MENKTTESALQELREACRTSLWIFAQTVEPHRVYGSCHKELYDWWQKCELEQQDNTLSLMPRDHQKSHCVAVWAAWQIYRNPAVTILYVCATQDLAIKQLYDIKNLLISDEFRLLSPDMVNEREKDREKWAEQAIIVDHPLRRKERPRDPTVQAVGIDSNVIGAHCNIMIKDDVVIDKNSETESARMKVSSKAGHLSSILTTDGKEWVVGTRYHPKDHYQDLIDMEEEQFDEDDNIIGTRKVYAIHERKVETNGIFLWPRMARESDGKMFGFDVRQLARKKAKYGKDIRNYFCQYYNDPNAINQGGISSSQFIYYNKDQLVHRRGNWYFKDKLLTVVGAIDFAYSQSRGSDWTCIVVLGMDCDKNIYILDIHRFQTKQPSVYWKNLEAMYLKWGFRYCRAEAVAAQEVIIESLKDYITEEAYNLRIIPHKPNSMSGNKDERILQALEPHYEDGTLLHYRGGLCESLEDELTNDRPPHDDIKDTLSVAVSFDKLKPPPKPREDDEQDEVYKHYQAMGSTRFGSHF